MNPNAIFAHAVLAVALVAFIAWLASHPDGRAVARFCWRHRWDVAKALPLWIGYFVIACAFWYVVFYWGTRHGGGPR